MGKWKTYKTSALDRRIERRRKEQLRMLKNWKIKKLRK